ncbi:MAG: tRNA uridine-5-carboxymethylaminomethyl(34) synthesis enzyme MnmG, partial [Proteobacteria bacterium]|nr:tRNA uridine-5-carboxymethylaminomethyl(34) synthesis enzyme MnmG [Pseudomonadota bacterium]
AEIEIKYAGYIEAEAELVKRLASVEEATIPEGFDYDNVAGLSTEVRQKLKAARPMNLGQASRVPGVTPAAVSIMMIALRQRRRYNGRGRSA